MGSYICDEIQNKYLRRFLRAVFFLIGITPYVVLSILIVIGFDKYFGFTPPSDILQILKDQVLFYRQIITGAAIIGSWVTWYFFCKILSHVWIIGI